MSANLSSWAFLRSLRDVTVNWALQSCTAVSFPRAFLGSLFRVFFLQLSVEQLELCQLGSQLAVKTTSWQDVLLAHEAKEAYQSWAIKDLGSRTVSPFSHSLGARLGNGFQLLSFRKRNWLGVASVPVLVGSQRTQKIFHEVVPASKIGWDSFWQTGQTSWRWKVFPIKISLAAVTFETRRVVLQTR